MAEVKTKRASGLMGPVDARELKAWNGASVIPPPPLSPFFPPSVPHLDGKPKDHARTRPSISSERPGKDAAEEEGTGAGKE